MKTTTIAALLLLTLVACSDSKSKSGDTPPAADDKAKSADTEPADDKVDPPAADTAEGSIEATIGGEKMSFSHLPKDSNYMLKTNMGIEALTEPGGAALLITVMHRTLGPDTKYPHVLQSSTPEELTKMHKEHQAALKAGEASKMAIAQVSLIYVAKDGAKLFDTNLVLKVESFDGSRLKGSFDATLKPKRSKDGVEPVALTEGTFDVVLKTPAAGRAVEKAVTGE